MNIFGFNITKNQNAPADVVAKVVDKHVSDGGISLSDNAYSISYSIEPKFSDKRERIAAYRGLTRNEFVSHAINEISNEAIVIDGVTPYPLTIDPSNIKFSDKIKEAIVDEFSQVLRLLKFDWRADDVFESWYVDGEIYFHVIFGEKGGGISKLIQVDPSCLTPATTTDKKDSSKVDEFYIYRSVKNKDDPSKDQVIRIAKEQIVTSNSGITSNGNIISFLESAIKPTNQLNMLEDALVIYRIARAPERRIFYVDVGNLPKTQAEQYMQRLINNQKNKMVYDTTTGHVKNGQHVQSMMEDIWLPRKGGRSTEVSTLPGVQQLNLTDDLEYFNKKLIKSLKVPSGRFESDAGYSLSRSGEVTKEEIKFGKFIDKLRRRFSVFIVNLLRIQLIDKKIIAPDDWSDIKDGVQIQWNSNNYFTELKESEILANRLSQLADADNYIGKYFSATYAMRNILKMTDSEIKQQQAEIKADKKSGLIQQDQGDY